MTFSVLFVVGAILNQVSCNPVDIVGKRPTNNVGIYGGRRISIEDAPFMASLRSSRDGLWNHVCGASIIHEQFILTAAHCIAPDREYKVLVGTDNVNGVGGDMIDIDSITLHHKYDNVTLDHDACLLKLKTPLTFSTKVNKIYLDTVNVHIPNDTELNITGWGMTETNEKPTKLRRVDIPKIGKARCKSIYSISNIPITPGMMCAGKRGHDSCRGDSGGPLTLGNIQVGITSFGDGCGKIPGVYTKVSSVASWVTKNLIDQLL